MPSLNLDLDFFDHPKVKRLIGLLGKGSEVLPIRLWAYCGKYHCDSGRLTEISAQEIESIMCWWGTSGVAVEALVKVGFLELVPEGGGYQVHDWLEHEGHLVAYKKKARAAALKRWEKVNQNSCLEHAPSIASSNAKDVPKQCLATVLHCPDSSSEGNGVLGERETCAENPSGWLARVWCMHTKRTKNGCNQDKPEDVAPIMEVLHHAGFSEREIEQAIKERSDDTEYPWEFKKRLLESKGQNGKPNRLTAKESVARRREKEAESA